ncbi:hypothetical protein [Methanoculleus sp. 10]|uniref:hypothetical protein n=1 Tax=Methanoculleus sp. 10 TaxID=430615 RepID=UPI0025E03ACC|nr:hypothetical protein [Methanoculleus sp. 10]
MKRMNARRLARVAVVLVLAAWICGTAAAEELTVNDPGNVTAGETVTISGTTNIAPGNRLAVTVAPVGFGPANKSAPAGAAGTSGTVVVEAGNATANTWSFAANTAGFEPGEYSVAVEWVEGDASASTTFTVTAAAAATPSPAVTSPAATGTAPPTTSPTPTAAGPALPVAAALAAGVAGWLARRR